MNLLIRDFWPEHRVWGTRTIFFHHDSWHVQAFSSYYGNKQLQVHTVHLGFVFCTLSPASRLSALTPPNLAAWTVNCPQISISHSMHSQDKNYIYQCPLQLGSQEWPWEWDPKWKWCGQSVGNVLKGKGHALISFWMTGIKIWCLELQQPTWTGKSLGGGWCALLWNQVGGAWVPDALECQEPRKRKDCVPGPRKRKD